MIYTYTGFTHHIYAINTYTGFTHCIYAINTYTHNTGVYNEDTKIWQLSDKIMQVVGGIC
jgi:hypothetical protein